MKEFRSTHTTVIYFPVVNRSSALVHVYGQLRMLVIVGEISEDSYCCENKIWKLLSSGEESKHIFLQDCSSRAL